MHFSYLFMHGSLFDVEQKYPADEVCFNNNFEPFFQLVIL